MPNALKQFKELGLLKKSQAIVKAQFGRLGINKKQELSRLLFEIAKREGALPQSIMRDAGSSGFHRLKHYLLKRRFPHAYFNKESAKPYLPKIELGTGSIFGLAKNELYPERIFVEKKAARSRLAQNFKKFLPNVALSEIPSLKDYLGKNKNFTIKDYNNRRGTFFITYEGHDFFKKCPCTKRAVVCGYNIFNLGFGCIFECTYCYLQEYTNTPGIIFPANIGRFFDIFSSYKMPRMRIGTGEFSDSLMLDHVTEYSLPIVEFFKRYQEVTFEFKTKSANIGNLLRINHAGNIVAAWSLNPQRIIEENEFLAPSLYERIKAARLCTEAGYKVAFHFDPVIYFEGWEKEYKNVIDLLFSTINPKHVAWVSIGTLRINPAVKQVIERRFHENKILDEELVPGFDGKLRYPHFIRQDIYKSMLNMLSKHSRKLPVYLCMENPSAWKASGLTPRIL